MVEELLTLMEKSGFWKDDTMRGYRIVLTSAQLTADQIRQLTELVEQLVHLCEKNSVSSPSELSDEDKKQAEELFGMAQKAGINTGTGNVNNVADNPYWDIDGEKIYLYDKSETSQDPTLQTKTVEPIIVDGGTEYDMLITASHIVFSDGTNLEDYKFVNGNEVAY